MRKGEETKMEIMTMTRATPAWEAFDSGRVPTPRLVACAGVGIPAWGTPLLWLRPRPPPRRRLTRVVAVQRQRRVPPADQAATTGRPKETDKPRFEGIQAVSTVD